MKIPAPKAAVDKECGTQQKSETNQRWSMKQGRRAWPGGWGPQGMCPTGGGGLARVPNLRVCKYLSGAAHAGRDGWINILPQANVRAGKVLRPPLSERCRPWSWTLKKVLREADGPLKSDSTESLLRVERWSPRGAPRKPDGWAGEEPEDHKRSRNSCSKRSGRQGMGKIGEKFRRGTWRKSEVRKKWSMKQGRRAQKFILPHWWTSVIWKCWIGDKAPKKQRSSCTPKRHCERWFWILCSIYGTRIIRITNDASKGYGYHIQIARVRRTSSGRSLC